MKNAIFFQLIALVLLSCGGVNKIQHVVNEGNYGGAITLAIEKISKNKGHKKFKDHILILEDAFERFTRSEQANIKVLESESNPENLEKIYRKLLSLQRIQDRIKALLPLAIDQTGQQAQFEFASYESKIAETKSLLTAHLYDLGVSKINNAQSKSDYREAWNLLSDVEELYPNQLNTRQLLQEARCKGTYNVLVSFENLTEEKLPDFLVLELMALNNRTKSNGWAEFYRLPNPEVPFDFEVILGVEEIIVTPNRLIENQKTMEKEINEGKQPVLDRRGNVVKVSLGNPIEKEKTRRVKSKFNLITQEKTGWVSGKIAVVDLQSGNTISVTRVRHESNFRHQFARQRGDLRALEKWQRRLLNRKALPFPSIYELASDAGQKVNSDLTTILNREPFR